jgi:hypothetical protein
MRALLAAPFLLAALLGACSGRDYVKPSDRETVSFRFFLFAEMGVEQFHGSGDAVLEPGKCFRFRVYDNLLGSRLFDFSADPEGKIEIADYTEKAVLRRLDVNLGKALSEGLPLFFRDATAGELSRAVRAQDVEAAGSRLLSARFVTGKSSVKLSVSARNPDGRPRTVVLESGRNRLTLEISEYGAGDFAAESAGFPVRVDLSETPFLEWLGEAYAGR